MDGLGLTMQFQFKAVGEQRLNHLLHLRFARWAGSRRVNFKPFPSPPPLPILKVSYSKPRRAPYDLEIPRDSVGPLKQLGNPSLEFKPPRSGDVRTYPGEARGGLDCLDGDGFENASGAAVGDWLPSGLRSGDLRNERRAGLRSSTKLSIDSRRIQHADNNRHRESRQSD